ncbi:heavy metal translocating P-type ATPase [Lacisediminihabitans changchengi]|uniref:Cadmium-translocating P-type ATPase n=1 Tax=Lacisediminihabitans changchengi TaxID=2787634 RepID=A0A934SHX3_9MICO|nr:heavy metal translocating P-type ATPase [Lacisediminihabitans changchengi]MBK4346972.1 cadmium-translocating P-type ATPase [Lacisediminihabitans changchengi]MBK4347905.1 cadmium-translocating P-type ATPase [Lacisediminihabitans changchengi]
MSVVKLRPASKTIRPHQRARAGALRLARRYALLIGTMVIGVLGGILAVTGLEQGLPWLFGGYCTIVGVGEAVIMVRQMMARVFGIDILAVLAIGSTVAVGEYVASLIIVVMLAGGRALEDFAEGRAEAELSALLDREPRIAHLLTGDDEIADVDVGAVAVGDRIVVRSGEMVPVDATLESEDAAFDLSSVSGESMPVTTHRGEIVYSGAINGSTVSTLRTIATAADSQYQGIVALVRRAAENKAPVVRLADRYALPFTAVAVVIAAVAWMISGDPKRAAEVLVLATPCPLVLAAPVAFIGGMSRSARVGIVMKGGAVLELLARARTVVFDKTGTLTTGTPTIVRIRPESGLDATQLLRLAASAEQYSSHVLAASIARAAQLAKLTLLPAEGAVEKEARGVDARVDGRLVSVGSRDFIATRCTAAPSTPISGGELAIYVAIDGRFGGAIVATDPVRANARDTIARLAAFEGIGSIRMLTGDSDSTAEHVAGEVGISDLRARCLPADKVEAVRAIDDRPVIMVGDGVNDAPVLAAADVGIAMGARGASAASESASAVLLLDDISLVVSAIVIGRRSVRIALQSIWIGIGLSVGLMIIAAFGFIPAVVGAALQEVVDLATILNALRTVRVPRATPSAKLSS